MQLIYALLRQSASMSRPAAEGDPGDDEPPSDGLTTRDAELLKTLKSEADRVADKIHSLYMARESVIALTSTATGGVIALTASTARYAAILLLPFILLGLTAYATDRANEMKALGGYGRALEERVNGLLGERCLMWESQLAPNLRNTTRCVTPLRVFRLGALGLSALGAGWAAFNPDRFMDNMAGGNDDISIAVPYIVGGVVLYIVAAIAAYALYQQYRTVGNEAYHIAGGRQAAPAVGSPTSALD